MPKPLNLSLSVYNHYKSCHNVADLDLLKDIIDDLYLDYSKTTIDVFNDNELYANNIFVMKKEDFNNYCNFIFSVINEYLKRMNFDTMESITEYVKNNKNLYLKKSSPNNEVWYQSRIGGFLAERVFTIFIKKNFSKPKHYNIILTEKKYNKNT